MERMSVPGPAMRYATTRSALAVQAASAVPARTASRSIIGLDLLRFGAALSVAGFHLGCTSWLDPKSEAAGLLAGAARYPELLFATRFGWIGVQMFFVISGFVIAFSAQGSSAARFLESRFLRLMPGIWLCATISVGLALAFSPEGAGTLLDRYMRTLVIFPAPRWIDGVYWTLSIEMAFYALVWMLLFQRRLSHLEPLMIAIGLSSAAIWAVAASGQVPGLDVLANKRVAQLLLVTHGCEFALGVLAWSIANRGATAWRLLAAVGCFTGTLLQILASCREVSASQGLDEPFVVAAGIFIGFSALFVLTIGVNGPLVRVLPTRLSGVVRLLGLSTYPLYLLHTFIGALSIRTARSLGVTPVPALVLGIAVAIVVAILVAQVAEPWLRGQLKGVTARWVGGP